MPMQPTYWMTGLALAAAALVSPIGSRASAHVTRIVVETTTPAPAAKIGAADYVIIRGAFWGEIDPADPRNSLITDLDAAPRNARGWVEYSATFALARPRDPLRASGVLLYDAPNRGRGDVQADPDGHIRLVSGWQGDIKPAPGRQVAIVPIAQGLAGAALEGPVIARMIDVAAGTKSVPITAGLEPASPRPPPSSLDTSKARLYRQHSDREALTEIQSDAWSFGDCSHTPFPGAPDPGQLCLRDGFLGGQAYTLVYSADKPPVLGVGFAATRDLVSFLRHDVADASSAPNPVAGLVRWAIATGNSQSGNFLRSFLHLGFNEDELRRRVFDGMNPNIAGRHIPLNVRFGVPGGAANLYDIGSEGPLWWSLYDDRVRGLGPTSLLGRCTVSETCPKIMETFGAAEFWGLRMSPNLVGIDNRSDLPLPANVRRYYFPSVSHGGSMVGGFPLTGDKPNPYWPKCVLAGNPNPSSDTLRALLEALIAWVAKGVSPPASKYPKLSRGDLVEPTAIAMGWPNIPGAPKPDGKINPFYRYDLGPDFKYADVSGRVAVQPPRIIGENPLLAPRVNRDGNEVAGIASVQLQAPLGTYTGWNERAVGYGVGEGCGFFGGFIPFTTTRAERLAKGDPRFSLEERYGSHQGYVTQVRKAVRRQIKARWLLPEDAEKLLRQAEQSEVLRKKPGAPQTGL